MTKSFEVFMWCVAILMVLHGLLIENKSSFIFWTDVHSNFLGSFLALIIGIPIAIFINDTFHKKIKMEERKRNKEKFIEIIKLIKEELDWNSCRLKERIADKQEGNLSLNKFKNNYFNSLQYSGQISYIEDTQLLNRIVSVYFVLDTLRSIEKLCYESTRGATVMFGVKTGARILLEDSYGYYDLLASSLTEALLAINRHLKTKD